MNKNNETSQTLNPQDRVKLIAALNDMSTSFTRVEAEKSLQKNVRDDICEELNLNKKVFSRLATTWHKQNFADEVEASREFEDIYQSIETGS